jgi:PAS domain S-box-containing protein
MGFYMAGENIDDIQIIKNKLINISLVLVSIAGAPLLFTTIAREIKFELPPFWHIYSFIFFLILVATIFRKRLNYVVKSLSLLACIFSLGVLDLFEVGFTGIGYMWLATAVIVTSLYYDIKRSVITLVLSVSSVIIIYILYKHNVISYPEITVANRFPVSTLQIYTLILIMIGLMVSFSFRLIYSYLISNNQSLKEKKQHLEEITSKLRSEINIRRKSELLALNNEKNFRNIFDKSSDAILIVDVNRTILDFNDAFIRLSGFKENEIFSLGYDQFLAKEDRAKYLSIYENFPNCPGRLEFKIENTSNGLRYIDCSISTINYNGQDAVLLMIRDYTEKIELEKKNYLSVIEAEEKERSRFSKELHDGLGPLLSTLKIYLDVFFANPNEAEVRERIENTLTESIKSVKEISNNISPYILENMGLIKAVNSFIEKIKFGKKIEFDFQTNLDHRLSPEIEISIYRFMTELINNTLKHAKASLIQINIEEKDNTLNIHYRDNGIGFDLEDVSLNSKGIGLFNLKSRIEKLGGRIEMNSMPDQGFSIFASLKNE